MVIQLKNLSLIQSLLRPQFLGFLLREDGIELFLQIQFIGFSVRADLTEFLIRHRHRCTRRNPRVRHQLRRPSTVQLIHIRTGWIRLLRRSSTEMKDFLSRSPSPVPETEGVENLVASPVQSPETHGVKLVLLILTNWDNKGHSISSITFEFLFLFL